MAFPQEGAHRGANGADPVGALRVGPELLVPGLPDGSLSGTTFVAKDLFDVAGHRTGAGNPTWLEETQPAEAHAIAVARLVEAGADLIGKAHTDELGYSIAGTNVHYGTPVNTAASDRLPGGSSSGPAAAVAAGTTDIGLGTDTGGSIRVPASYCGLVGLRPTHGRVPAGGTVPLAPSFDTAGLLTRDGTLARRAAAALLDPFPDSPPPVSKLLICADAAHLLDPEAAEPWRAAVEALAAKTGLTLGMGEIARDLEPWRAAFAALQGAEAWAAHGSWITRTEPELATDVADRFRTASLVTAGQVAAAQPVRELARRRTRQLLAPGTALVLPSACGPPPPVGITGGELADVRLRTVRLTCVAGLAGLPALSLPLAEVDGLPLGVCLVAPRGGDETLLDIAAAVLP